MNCPNCTHWNPPQTRIRMTPTFYHSPIFDEYDPFSNQSPMRCTATYHSTVFDGAHHHHRARKADNKEYCCGQSTKQRPNSARGTQKENTRGASLGSQSRLQKQNNVCSQTQLTSSRLNGPKISRHTLLWYDTEKEMALRACSKCSHHGLPMERKLVQLSSSQLCESK